jgi:adenine/guanine phosphoribosyltransferase-like PRPP-binding protein
MQIRSTYMRRVFQPALFSKIVDHTMGIAEQLHQEYKFDTIAFSGTSGAAMAFILSHKMGLPLLCVRKQEITSHYTNSGNYLEGNIGARKYLIVDDFISSGETIRYIVSTIHKQKPATECVAILMYNQKMGGNYQFEGWKYPVPCFGSRPEIADDY